MAETSNTNPHINSPNSPLDVMIRQALRRFGDSSPGAVSGDAGLMFLEFANVVVDEVRQHPYWGDDVVDYYEHITETRAIPDPIVVQGMLYQYSGQQASEKTPQYAQQFIRQLNQSLWHRLNGNTPIQMIVRDGGSNREYSLGTTTSAYNGTVKNT